MQVFSWRKAMPTKLLYVLWVCALSIFALSCHALAVDAYNPKMGQGEQSFGYHAASRGVAQNQTFEGKLGYEPVFTRQPPDDFANKSTLSIGEAQARIVQISPLLAASQKNTQASQISADTTWQTARPIVSLSAAAFAYKTKLDIPTEPVKEAIFNGAVSELERVNDTLNLPDAISAPLEDGFALGLDGVLGRFDDEINLTTKDHDTRASLSVLYPLYTGGSADAAWTVAQAGLATAEQNQAQVAQTEQFRLIKNYYDAQFAAQQRKLADKAQASLSKHLYNANALYTQGMISRSESLQVAALKAKADHRLSQAEANERLAQQQLANLLGVAHCPKLSSPLFVGSAPSDHTTDALMAQAVQHNPAYSRLQSEQEVAQAGVALLKATQKPKLYAFGRHSLTDSEWVAGLGARFELFGATDKAAKVQAANAQTQAIDDVRRARYQDLQLGIEKAVNEMNIAVQSLNMVAVSIQAAEENLRVQTIAFKEGEARASAVTDAQSVLQEAEFERAANAYRYTLALASLLYLTGELDTFAEQAATSRVKVW